MSLIGVAEQCGYVVVMEVVTVADELLAVVFGVARA